MNKDFQSNKHGKERWKEYCDWRYRTNHLGYRDKQLALSRAVTKRKKMIKGLSTDELLYVVGYKQGGIEMVNKEKIVKRIMEICPYKWAKDREDVERTLGYWLKEDDMWGENLGCQTGGFVFNKSKSGRRYIETLPIRIYID